MILADRIRQFVLETYIEPARLRGDKTIKIRAGDVNDSMGLTSRQPAVAGALGAVKFQDFARLRLLSREGPHQGANLVFTFELL